MKEFKREDYIYLRYIDDDKDNLRKKGDILRYYKNWLIDEMKGRRFNTCFDNDSLIWEKNPDTDENEIMFNKVYKSITVAKDWKGWVYLWPDDYLYLDNWLFSHLDSRAINLITNLKSDIVSNVDSNKLIKLTEGCPYVNAEMSMYFSEGEQIDFTTPAVAALFYNPYWIKLFAKTEVIVGKEKEQLFQEDFSNAICVQTVDFYGSTINHEAEHHYFKLKDNIKVKTSDEIANMLGLDHLTTSFNLVKNSEGYITHISTVTNLYDNSDRTIEQNILKIANKTSKTEALDIHKKACLDYIKKQKETNEKFMKEYEKRQKILDEKFQKVKNNPEMFPGVNGDFLHTNSDSDNSNQKYNLNQIKNFYQKLKTLDNEIVKNIYFYGGTVPYILNNASKSRDFGDIDMFVPTEHMEKLREEFTKQESFKMLCDSKTYTEFCMLTTRIAKESTEITLTNQEENLAQSLFDFFTSLMTPNEYKREYVDENGIVHNPLTAHKEKYLPYYRKIQDFGFKAKLFGINISVFPIYEYENNIMAKSFNINEMYKFLLGVKILNNTKLAEFTKQVKIYDSIFNILPLEYTLASKQNAVDEKYASRYEKDKEDVEYILSHKDELKISDDQLRKILSNYPDYSISIAYRINSNGTTKTMDGEDYKRLVITNRNIS